ncbi:Arylsulfatase A [Rubritalea squalenifaciens DSM 18772]|uniref:Arylsulfatase A n=1 Tax=Rubritalea squalenifaciens DSM 18772 TaxID=1123071 RepID=A0A1M6BFA0_9BACT|nr:sulfatase [Rubritalea squalenifaciens]SHI47258.1 Arylsulfatase A [Rubritalea squalenifaciens DSM 18772]
MKTLHALSLALACSLTAAPQKPNVVVFLVDDMGVMDTSVPFLTDESGNPKSYPLNEWYRTPNMERLAKQGIRFTHFYAQSVCSPTRASIMTGQNATRHHTTQFINPGSNNRGKFGPPEWNWKGLTKNALTLPRILQKNGYRTIHVGKGHFGPLESEGAEPLNLGFEVNIAGSAIGRPGTYVGDYGQKSSRPVPGLEKYHNTGTFLTEALTFEANKAIDDSVKDKKPFYLYMSHYAVHGPFTPDPRYIGNYKGKSKGACAFAALVEGMDKSLGDIMDHLDQIGQAENTLILFLGDNGSACPVGKAKAYGSSAPLRGMKGTCYEGGTRVPFIAAWAKSDPDSELQKAWPIAQGKLQAEAIGTVMDIFPTVLDLTGTESPKGHPVDGFNLKALFSGKDDPLHEQAFLMHFPHDHKSSYFTSLRLGDWKLIYHYFGKKRYELYNLKEDPFEKNDLAEQEGVQVQRLCAELKSRLVREDAQYPIDAAGKVLTPE